MDNFSKRLKQLRNEKGLTLDELKDALGTTKATLSRYENGLREPKIDFANKAANYFNVSLDYILGVSDVREVNELSTNESLAQKLLAELEENNIEFTQEDIPDLIKAVKIALAMKNDQ
ncbi:helix-turn-helix domain-containing protein [Clostridium perfringens]|uniref:helix-turn-helix domain-containing protein n=1 Tax=Clostridium perfringens TaxID=1502 RepID=UPI00016BDDB3|nr:helix-turn-helix domain-containing protein [Clostridium perfringens]EDT27502.1 immunity repressor protein [Clostridium perfringens CPE str. F4969]MDH5093859.1 HTH-type transcriptional regulator Xre [Clostridium perfringens]MDK0670390.1 helix-turn-helix domain-containing protein [Clostridium perfringens]MDM0517612.1 helix-turn-helix domain-containing protein [Clostridium perfringens]MDM0972491.1 helix-turn-helix domain-containing protein [Clostridium perfringens]